MRCGIIVAAALAATGFAALPPTGAHAEQYCGFVPHLGAIVQCGYSTIEGCENAVGKGAMCFVNPYLVFNERRTTPMIGSGPLIERA